MKCDDCPLAESAKSACIPARGSGKPDVLFIGQAPGAEEDRAGECFVGPAGQLLEEACREYGITKYRLTNVVRCAPPGDREPNATEIKACAPRLAQDLHRFKGKVVVLLGNVALNAVLKRKGIAKLSGRPIVHEGKTYLPLLHPAHILRTPSKLPEWEALFSRLADMAAGKSAKRPPATLLRGAAAARAIRQCKGTDTWAFDFETTGLYPWEPGARILSVALSDGKRAYAMPFTKGVERAFKTWAASSTPKCAANVKFEVTWCRSIGAKLNGVVFDTMLAHVLIDEESSHALSSLAHRYTDYGGYDDEMEEAKRAGGWEAALALGEDKLLRYNAGDAFVTALLMREFVRRMSEEQLRHMRVIDIPAAFALARMEENGFFVDQKRLAEVERELEARRADLRAAMANIAGREDFNPRSVPQVKAVLASRRIRAEDESTRAPDMEHLKERHPFVRDLLEYRSTATLLSTYVLGVRSRIDGRGLVHSSFNQHVTNTGRLSSTNPNLQNLPREGPIKSVYASRFVGGTMLQADFAQFEPRVIACLTGDPFFVRVFKSGGDLHLETAKQMFPKRDPREARDDAKRINMASINDVGPDKLMREFHISMREATDFLARFRRLHLRMFAWLNDIKKTCARTGSVTSVMGRTRHLPDALSRDTAVKMHALRQAASFVIQSPASELTTWCCAKIQESLDGAKLHSLLVGTVHDSIVIDCAKGELERVRKLVKRVAEHDAEREFDWISVPLVVDVKHGKSLKA